MKKIILSTLFALSLASAGGFTPAFADHHECSCDKECTEKCSNGDHKDCTCKTCDCGKGEECKHGKCSTKKGKKAAQKADAAKAGEAHAH
jgi:hypothetical protein